MYVFYASKGEQERSARSFLAPKQVLFNVLFFRRGVGFQGFFDVTTSASTSASTSTSALTSGSASTSALASMSASMSAFVLKSSSFDRDSSRSSVGCEPAVSDRGYAVPLSSNTFFRGRHRSAKRCTSGRRTRGCRCKHHISVCLPLNSCSRSSCNGTARRRMTKRGVVSYKKERLDIEEEEGHAFLRKCPRGSRRVVVFNTRQSRRRRLPFQNSLSVQNLS